MSHMFQAVMKLLRLFFGCLCFFLLDPDVLVGFDKLIVLQVFLLEEVDLLLAFLAQQLVLFDEEADEGIDRFDLFEIDDGQVADKDGQLLLLHQEWRVLEVLLDLVGGDGRLWRLRGLFFLNFKLFQHK